MVYELAGKAREALKVLALPLCKEGVEGEGALTASTDTREYRHLAVWNIEIDTFEIVRLCPADLNARAIFTVHVRLAVGVKSAVGSLVMWLVSDTLDATLVSRSGIP